MSSIQPSRVDRILAVDDSPDNLFLVQTILEDRGYEISLAEDGRSALEKIEKLPPDLILLDVMMPGMDGYEVTRRVRQAQRFRKLPFIPILLITAHEQSSVVEGLDAGADDFIRKPVDVDELLARVRSLLRLKHSIDEREQMVRQREDFVSRLTHDLRTPLVAADRMLNLFRDGAFGDVGNDMDDAFTIMIRSNKNLLQMVNTLLEVYRHEAGQKNLIFSSLNLQDLLQEVVQELMPLAKDKGVELQTETIDEAAATTSVQGDRLELQRVFTNLVGNAIKFTDCGFVAVRLLGIRERNLSESTLEAGEFNVVGTTPSVNEGQLSRCIAIEIQDTGSGISPEDQASLFQRFRQGEHKRAGSGLGLYLSQRIIEAHRGMIEVKSELGQGSTFTIYLPIRS
ncbi:MAG TPA: hybrid sensor histidine kinase/response regulator [Trichocoleus sp.]|jgi:signal transduction histidine kinase